MAAPRVLLVAATAALLTLLPCPARGLTAARPRYAIEFPVDIVLLRGPSEPPFNKSAVKTCTLDRVRGYLLNTPGFAHGHPGENQVWGLQSPVSCCLCGHLREALGPHRPTEHDPAPPMHPALPARCARTPRGSMLPPFRATSSRP